MLAIIKAILAENFEDKRKSYLDFQKVFHKVLQRILQKIKAHDFGGNI